MAYMIDTKSHCRRMLQFSKNEPLIPVGVAISRTVQATFVRLYALLNHASALNLKVEETGAMISGRQTINAHG